MTPSGIRTHDLSRRAAVDLRLRPRGYILLLQNTDIFLIILVHVTFEISTTNENRAVKSQIISRVQFRSKKF